MATMVASSSRLRRKKERELIGGAVRPVVMAAQECPSAMRAHVLEVPAGRDVLSCVAQFARRCRRGALVLGAAGHAVVGRTPMQILSLVGCFFPGASAGAAGTAVFLAGPRGTVLGGAVAQLGGLVAAGPVVVMLATFVAAALDRLPLPPATVRVGAAASADFNLIKTNPQHNRLGSNRARNLSAGESLSSLVRPSSAATVAVLASPPRRSPSPSCLSHQPQQQPLRFDSLLLPASNFPFFSKKKRKEKNMASDPPAQPQAPPKPTRVSLSYEEISKLFSLPIAEAASILGVCTSVLKRICRSHGIVRWPYRKLVSGKAGDDTKNSEREKAKELLELSKAAKQKAFSSSGSSAMPSSTSQGAGKSQQGGSKAGGQVSPPGKQNALGGLAFASQTKGIPTYMDDFKYGFPSSGLSRESMKWWGASDNTDSAGPAKDMSHESAAHDASKGMTDDDELDWGADEGEGEVDGAVTGEASAQLCSLRRKAVDDGRRLLNGESQQEFCRLNKRQKLVLAQVFGASLPEEWRSKLV
ncbi:hypothetical protein EJB05_32837, partial [Eragrostis curvula]